MQQSKMSVKQSSYLLASAAALCLSLHSLSAVYACVAAGREVSFSLAGFCSAVPSENAQRQASYSRLDQNPPPEDTPHMQFRGAAAP